MEMIGKKIECSWHVRKRSDFGTNRVTVSGTILDVFLNENSTYYLIEKEDGTCTSVLPSTVDRIIE
jgi:hypothetical protein